jgi:hypothetical protein
MYRPRVGWQLIHPDCFLIHLLYRLDFLHDFVENLTSASMEAFIIASIFFS